MKKLVTIGLSSLAMVSLTLGTSPATAAAAAPSLTDAVCESLPAQVLAASNTLTSSLSAQTTTTADLLTKLTAFGSAQAGFTAAVVDYVKAYDAGAPLAGRTQVVYDTLGVYSEKFAAWSNALSAKEAADEAVAIAGITRSVLSGVSTGLACPTV